MPEFDNPSFLQLGAEEALAFGLLLPEVFPLEFGALELALEAPEIFLGVPEMVPTMELAGGSARELELQLEKDLVRIPEFEPVTALGIAQGIAQSNRWVLSSQPLAMADLRTWLNIVLPAALVAPASLEVELALTAKPLEQNLDLAPFADSSCGSKGMKTLPLVFVPFWAIDRWPALLNGEDDRRHRRRGLVKETKRLREWCSDF